MIIGHVATAVLLKAYLPEEETVPIFISSLFPDIGDKTIRYIRQTDNGRTLFHSLLGFGLTLLILIRFVPRTTIKSWLIGYSFHLICDMGGIVPWFYPFIEYKFKLNPYTYRQKIMNLVLRPKLVETTLFIWAIYEGAKMWRKKTNTSGQSSKRLP